MRTTLRTCASRVGYLESPVLRTANSNIGRIKRSSSTGLDASRRTSSTGATTAGRGCADTLCPRVIWYVLI